jgi:hypothetical protein
MKFTNDALAAYNKGVADGTITDTVAEIIEVIMEQEIVSYCSENGTYSFDGGDLITGEDMRDLTGYTDAELSMLVFNSEKYYTCMINFGLLSVTNLLRYNSIEYTVAQWDMLCRDYHADLEEREGLIGPYSEEENA